MGKTPQKFPPSFSYGLFFPIGLGQYLQTVKRSFVPNHKVPTLLVHFLVEGKVLGGITIEPDTRVACPMPESFYDADSMRSRIGQVWFNPIQKKTRASLSLKTKTDEWTSYPKQDLEWQVAITCRQCSRSCGMTILYSLQCGKFQILKGHYIGR